MDKARWNAIIQKIFSDIQKNIDNASKRDSDIFKLCLLKWVISRDKEGRTALD
jgi:hypothetical protein